MIKSLANESSEENIRT